MFSPKNSESKRSTWVSMGQKSPKAVDIARGTFLVFISLIVLIPITWLVLSSFKTPTELGQRPPRLFPESISLDNYTTALESFGFVTYFTNSVIVTVGATILTLVINSMAAYAFAKFNFRGKDFLFILTLSTIMIPLQVILIPVYQVIAAFGMVNTYWGLIIPAAATPTGVFLLRQYMLTIPDELIEAARIDGMGEFKLFLTIILPLTKPALAVLAIFSIIWRWNDFLWPLIVAQDTDMYTLPVAIALFNAQLVVPFNLVLAMSVLTILPVIIIFLFLQKSIVTGIAQTGLK